MMRVLAAAALGALLFVPPTGADLQPADSVLVSGNNAFALDLHGLLSRKQGNLVCSPYSISSAFGMAFAGAAGETAEEMRAVLHFDLESDLLHPALGGLGKELTADCQDTEHSVLAANALWVQSGYGLKSPFLEVLKMNYGSLPRDINFAMSGEASRQINDWVAEQTRDKIRDLVPPAALGPLTRLVLTNAVYLMDAWQQPFPKRSTRDDDFWLLDGRRVTAPFMSQTKSFAYADYDTLQVIDLPYVCGQLSMTFFLPSRPTGLPALERSMDVTLLDDCIANLETTYVEVHIPPYSIRQSLSLKEVLRTLGMRRAFMALDADFSGMSDEQLYIAAAFQKAFIDVTEDGTEAAAATAVVVYSWGGVGGIIGREPPPVFRADHPFLFMIRHQPTGSILFIGRVSDPTS